MAATKNKQVTKREIRYIPGIPKEYRANCSAVNGNVKDFVTNETHKTFQFHPISYRFFEDKLFDDKAKNISRRWAELFFVDEQNCLGTILFHTYSVDNLKKLMSTLYYAGHDLHQAVIEVTFGEKKNREGKKFHIAEFDLVDADIDQEKMAEALAFAAEHKPYRGSTRTPNADIELSFNYPEIEQVEEVEI